jgi:AraC family transcriptional regulator of adaptative response/methylated-DNA-[protein]-cysteine methyltransferase
MSPATVRKAGEGQRIQFGIVDSSYGRLLVAWTEHGVCSVAFGDDDRRLERALRDDFSRADIRPAGPAIHEWVTAIVRSLDGQGVGAASAIPIDVQGTAFQRRVWRELQRIPRGTTMSYSSVARRVGRPGAARAVARACATNPVALVVPCHRVVREDGSLGGYRWGMERKREILDAEKAQRP